MIRKLGLSILCIFSIHFSLSAQEAEKLMSPYFDNLYKVNPMLFRSEQPTKGSESIYETLGIQSVLSLRKHHHNKLNEFPRKVKLFQYPIQTRKITENDIYEALLIIRDAPKPILIHCMHGSDRTGVVIAAYRMVFDEWSKAAAIDEFLSKEYGYHKNWFPNIETLLNELDVEALRKKLNKPF